MIKFQAGKFDNPNRLVKGINKEWVSCQTNPGNVKELIPEFYQNNPEFLVNPGLDLGVRANGKRVEDIKLPRWARTPTEYLQKMREALESDYVSQNLHKWIDLIFGYKQCSIEDNNVFHPVTYQGRTDLSVLNDPVQRLAFETQISEFGQTPKQIFFKAHPAKHSVISLEPEPQQPTQQSESQSALGSHAQSNHAEPTPDSHSSFQSLASFSVQ